MVLISMLTACAGQKPSPDEVRERTAEATAQLKSGAKAVAEGVKEGWNRDKPLDLNRATRDQISSLPGISNQQADSIIAARPYDDTHQLVSRRILSEREYQSIRDKVTAKD